MSDPEIIESSIVGEAGAALGRRQGRTVIVVHPDLTERERQRLIAELLDG